MLEKRRELVVLCVVPKARPAAVGLARAVLKKRQWWVSMEAAGGSEDMGEGRFLSDEVSTTYSSTTGRPGGVSGYPLAWYM